MVREWYNIRFEAMVDGRPSQERAVYLNSVADLAAKLRATGMTLEDVHCFEEIMLNPAVTSIKASAKAVEEFAETLKPDAFSSTVAMKARTGASYRVAEARLDEALMDLRLLLSDDDQVSLLEVQAAWEAYRSKLEDRALREYIGGTHATLAMALAGLAETERRMEEIRNEIVERRSR